MEFIYENRGTIIVAAVLAAIVAAIVINLVRKRRSGGCGSCGEGCAGCGGECRSTAAKGER